MRAPSARAMWQKSQKILQNGELLRPRDADVTGNGYVGLRDVLGFDEKYNLEEGIDEGFEEDYDVVCDGRLNVRDIARVGFEMDRSRWVQ